MTAGTPVPGPSPGTGARAGTWRRLEHTADLKIQFSAPDLESLFRVGAECLFETTLDRAAVLPRRSQTVSLRAAGPEELFLDWLRELLFLFSARGFALAAVTRLEITPSGDALKAELIGENYDPARHGLKLEIKSPTYHDYRLDQVPAGWQATLLFDI